MIEKITENKSVKVLLTLFPLFKIIAPSLNLVFEEEVVMIFSKFDWLCLFWIPVLNCLGQTLKRLHYTEKQRLIPLSILMIYAGFFVCGVIGCFRLNLATSRDYEGLICYAIVNGISISFVSIVLFDLVSGLIANTLPRLKKLFAFIFKKKEKKNEK